MKSRKAGIFNVTQIFLMDGKGLEDKTELMENVNCKLYKFEFVL